jgi:hypothetical protein
MTEIKTSLETAEMIALINEADNKGWEDCLNKKIYNPFRPGKKCKTLDALSFLQMMAWNNGFKACMDAQKHKRLEERKHDRTSN